MTEDKNMRFYDYFADRHGWEGVDGSNMRSIDQALRAVGLSPGLSEQLRPPWESLGSP